MTREVSFVVVDFNIVLIMLILLFVVPDQVVSFMAFEDQRELTHSYKVILRMIG